MKIATFFDWMQKNEYTVIQFINFLEALLEKSHAEDKQIAVRPYFVINPPSPIKRDTHITASVVLEDIVFGEGIIEDKIRFEIWLVTSDHFKIEGKSTKNLTLSRHKNTARVNFELYVLPKDSRDAPPPNLPPLIKAYFSYKHRPCMKRVQANVVIE